MSETKRSVITTANIEKFIGKTIDCKRGMFHHYPLTFSKIAGEYFYTDRNEVTMPFHDNESIFFDSVRESSRFNAMTEDFEEVTFLNRPALFTPIRIDRTTVPRGYHVYEVRHDDDCQGDAVQIARNITVNHWGTLIMRDRIKLPPDGYLDIEPEALNYDTGDCQSLKEFMGKYPPKTRPPKDYER
jgi:hypothetical protein